ncbi:MULTISPECIES: diacylglycerol/lipid kinase family protein [Corynebacterium]|uniref:Diacylglycerol kinase family protein n=1 Tax=Corynebacterium pseudodiphtheriticum TaxID=37637 RepID=A0AAP4F6X2_9CORY|nr:MULTISPECIES: diacylglycerol kinase family protein [Corynebacterium]ERJ42058.1 diacylglycerol kinase [Corynebacterium pseudodiphtheriticum 090104]ERS42150.1 hypothetical protein HMPREF1292_00223 [Corynebacterium sp. KPL1995]ERS75158.1 hypothetical protein HMPREF1290_00224 [Corynebacterium sp. KPL1989]MCG7252973.1 diacylglycerol kinase family lipid kinase [Corynebacterium pseudodiphtheriticum]MCT1635954.1 diacylglycerol kinase family lipid kinase [Corynebacterium pseudodiphtheriticum]
MRLLLIANPNSTSQTNELFRRIIPLVRSIDDSHLITKFTHYAGHAEDMTRGLSRDDYDVVIAIGGDGTVNEVVNGLLGKVGDGRRKASEVPALAVIPTGSANVFVRALGYPLDPVHTTELLVGHIKKNLRRRIRLGTWNDRWFAVNAGIGIDADVLHSIDKLREQGFSATPLRYLRISYQAWRRILHAPPKISAHAESADGQTQHIDQAPLVFASNTNPWTFLGPLPVVTNPRNSFDKGLGTFGLTDLTGVGGFVGLLHLFGADEKGRLNKFTDARTLRFDDATRITLECDEALRFQADGEAQGKLKTVELNSIPDAIEVFSPEEIIPVQQRGILAVVRDLFRI